jgi:hypothetical protein
VSAAVWNTGDLTVAARRDRLTSGARHTPGRRSPHAGDLTVAARRDRLTSGAA